MEGRLFREGERRTTPVGTKGSLHPLVEKRLVSCLRHHEVGESVKTSRPNPPHRNMDIA